MATELQTPCTRNPLYPLLRRIPACCTKLFVRQIPSEKHVLLAGNARVSLDFRAVMMIRYEFSAAVISGYPRR